MSRSVPPARSASMRSSRSDGRAWRITTASHRRRGRRPTHGRQPPSLPRPPRPSSPCRLLWGGNIARNRLPCGRAGLGRHLGRGRSRACNPAAKVPPSLEPRSSWTAARGTRACAGGQYGVAARSDPLFLRKKSADDEARGYSVELPLDLSPPPTLRPKLLHPQSLPAR